MRGNESEDEVLNNRGVPYKEENMMDADDEKIQIFFSRKQYLRENQSQRIEFRMKGQNLVYSGIFYDYSNNSVDSTQMNISEAQIGQYIPTVFDNIQQLFKFCVLTEQFTVDSTSIHFFYYLHRPDSQISAHKAKKQIKLKTTKHNLSRQQKLEMLVNKLKQNRTNQISLKKDQNQEICQELLHLFKNVQNKHSECFSKEIDSHFNLISKNHSFLRSSLKFIVISNEDLTAIKENKQKGILKVEEKMKVPKISTPYRLFKEIETEKYWNIGKCWTIQAKNPNKAIEDLQKSIRSQLLSQKNRQGTVLMPYEYITNNNQLLLRSQQIWIFTEKGKYFSS